MKRSLLFGAVCAVAAVCLAGEAAKKVYCAQCGRYWTSRAAMGNSNCARHPDGFNKGPHKAYGGSEKSSYQCKYCGRSWSSIAAMTNSNCEKHPKGRLAGRHYPAK